MASSIQATRLRKGMLIKVGNDLFGEATVRNFSSFGIDTTHVRIIEGVSTGVAPIFVEPGGQALIANEEDNHAVVDPPDHHGPA